MQNISNERLDSIFEQAAQQARVLMGERAQDILRAWSETIEEAQEADKPFPELKLAFSVGVDLEGDKVETGIRFNCVYASKISGPLADPNQPELEMEGGEA